MRASHSPTHRHAHSLGSNSSSTREQQHHRQARPNPVVVEGNCQTILGALSMCTCVCLCVCTRELECFAKGMLTSGSFPGASVLGTAIPLLVIFRTTAIPLRSIIYFNILRGRASLGATRACLCLQLSQCCFSVLRRSKGRPESSHDGQLLGLFNNFGWTTPVDHKKKTSTKSQLLSIVEGCREVLRDPF